jgi:hypothetical protein
VRKEIRQMKSKIVFLVMSAVSKPETIDQLANALAPHVVLVHHDFSQTPDFPLTAANVIFVPEPKQTGWAHFGFVDGIFHSMQYALAHLDFDYLQLLSPTCLPIKPLRQFEDHIAARATAHFDCIDLLNDRDALMSVGYRAFTPQDSFRHRVARRISTSYFGAACGRRDEAGVWLRSGGGTNLPSQLALLTIKALSVPSLGGHIFDEMRPYYGSVWFGARRAVVSSLVQTYLRPRVREYFSRLRIAEEFLIPTLLMDAKPVKAPANHLIQLFDEAHPGLFLEQHLGQLKTSTAFFARKFPDDATAPVRLRVLGELVAAGVPHPEPVGWGQLKDGLQPT